MKPDRVIRHFGSQGEVARATGLSQQAVSQWLIKGRIPRHWHNYLRILMSARPKAERR